MTKAVVIRLKLQLGKAFVVIFPRTLEDQYTNHMMPVIDCTQDTTSLQDTRTAVPQAYQYKESMLKNFELSKTRSGLYSLPGRVGIW